MPTLLAASLASAQTKPLTLPEAIQFARLHNPALALARADESAANQASRTARAKALPQISANGLLATGSYGSIYPSSAQVDPPFSFLAPAGPLWDGNLSLMVPLTTGGRIGAQIASSSKLGQAAGYEALQMQSDVELAIEEAYWSAQYAQENEVAEQARVAATAETVRTTKAQFEAGKGIEASVRRAEAEQSEAARSLATARGEEEKALLDLRAQMGVSLDEPLLLSPSDPATFVTSLPPNSLARRPALLAAVARLAAADADVRAERALQSPQAYGVAMADASNQPMNRGSSVGITVSIPIFNGGERQAEVSRMKAMRDRAAASLAEVRLAALLELRKAQIDRQTAEANLASAVASEASAQATYDVVALRVSSGKGILVEQLDALQALTRARADHAKSRYDLRLADARMRHAAGVSLS